MAHALASPTAAQVMAAAPTGVLAMPRSSRIRTSTGNAVMLIAIPMKSANAVKSVPGDAYAGYSASAETTPRKNGTRMPV